MTNERVLELIAAWSKKVRGMRLLRSMSAKYTALGFATCIASLAQEAGADCPPDIAEFLKREGML